ncbi:hypothetical protein [Mucilaginibacter phyllosphaerae]
MPKQVKLLDANLKVLNSVWTENNAFSFDGLSPGTYMLSLDLTDGKNYQKIVSLDQDNVNITFDLAISVKSVQRSGNLYKLKNVNKGPGDLKMLSSEVEAFIPELINVEVYLIHQDSKRPIELIQTFAVTSVSKITTTFELNSDQSAKVFLFISKLFSPKLVSCPPDSRLTISLKYEKNPIHPLVVNIATNNYMAEAVLDLIAKGGIRDAKMLMNARGAERLLKEKRYDCSAAAVGGYYLLKMGELVRLHDWANNLANWFDYLPDGAIIHAWQMISERNAAVGDIKRRLLEAVRRGIPVYTEGLRLLYNALDQLVEMPEKDQELEAVHRHVKALSQNADWAATITSINNFELDPLISNLIESHHLSHKIHWPK